MNATLKEMTDCFVVVDEYGGEWDVVADDGSGNAMIERDGGERWEAGQFSLDRHQKFGDGGRGEITSSQEGSTFGVSCQDEFVVHRTDNAGSLRWVENVVA